MDYNVDNLEIGENEPEAIYSTIGVIDFSDTSV